MWRHPNITIPMQHNKLAAQSEGAHSSCLNANLQPPLYDYQKY